MAEQVIVQKLSLQEKVSLLSGSSYWRTKSFPEHRIRAIKFSDGPNGVRGEHIHASTKTYCFPAGVCIGASFNETLVYEMGRALAKECRLKNVGVILGPTVNLHRSPLGGRNFESYSEDPTLSGILGANYVNGVQSENVAACPKHFVGNECEKYRKTSNTIVDEKVLRELYAYPFQLMMRDSDPWTFMTSYNKVNGTWMSENKKLLQGLLRDEWGFKGTVISDFEGVYNTAQPALAGCNVEMPGPPRYRGEKLVQAVQDGIVPESQINILCCNVIKLANRFGMDDENLPEQVPNDPKTESLVRQIASEGIVLLKNKDNALPLIASSRPKIAVFGSAAVTPVIHGGGSASVTPTKVLSPLRALQAAYESDNISYHPGVPIFKKIPSAPLTNMKRESDGEAGVDCYWYNGSVIGENLVHKERLETTRTLLIDQRIVELEPQHCSRMHYILTPSTTGQHVFGITACGATTLKVDGKEILHHPGFDDVKVEYIMQPGDFEIRADLLMNAGQEYHIVVESHSTTAPVPSPVFKMTPQATQVGFFENLGTPLGSEIESLTSSADISIVFTANNKEFESESFDRETLSLTPLQEDLVSLVSKSSRKTIVVNMTGSPITMPWLDSVDAVLQTWFAGQEVGNALADIISGKVNPSGKLPMTFPKRIEDTPSYGNFPTNENHQIRYAEGLQMGYRARKGLKPLFPFGHGLSYTAFSVSDLKVSPTTINPADAATADAINVDVMFSIKNVGSVSGKEVVQVYVDGVLKAFMKVEVLPGQEKSENVKLDKYAFSEWDVQRQSWVIAKKKYVVEIRKDADMVVCQAEVQMGGETGWVGL